jgi:hypothetical protein
VIREIGNGKKEIDACREFYLKILDPLDLEKHKKNYIGVLEQNRSRIKRFRNRERSDVDRAPLEWF